MAIARSYWDALVVISLRERSYQPFFGSAFVLAGGFAKSTSWGVFCGRVCMRAVETCLSFFRGVYCNGYQMSSPYYLILVSLDKVHNLGAVRREYYRNVPYFLSSLVSRDFVV
jgi:hypothetical protein